ncbi:hypothetical protein GCM10009839_63600 [Catenulispora yoronensis]|uniref:Uncharacterized protein n=1 Tax=Catenulispora yoronensis TaxID=450799 RepID=A0ABP5GM19_9ACTN
MIERFDKGDVVRVRDEPSSSVVVLPSYCKPNPEDLPDNMPPIDVCCVPIALVSTTTEAQGEVLRWVELSDLQCVVAGDTMADQH